MYILKSIMCVQLDIALGDIQKYQLRYSPPEFVQLKSGLNVAEFHEHASFQNELSEKSI